MRCVRRGCGGRANRARCLEVREASCGHSKPLPSHPHPPPPYPQAISSGFEFAAVPLFHPRYRRDTGAVGDAVGAPAGQPLRDVPATREW